MTLEELKNILQAGLETSQLNSRNEALTKKRQAFHEGKATAFTKALDLIKMYEQTGMKKGDKAL